MENFYNPNPIDREIKVNSSTVLMLKVNKDGIIEYINHSFSEVSGYEEFEIIGESLDLLKHPDVPNAIYDLLKERFSKKESVRILNKILAKDGRYFWLMSDFETKTNASGEVMAHYAHCYAASSFATHKIDSLYKILLNIELKTGSTEVSKKYLLGFLEERNMDYDQFVAELSQKRPEFEDISNMDFSPITRQPINLQSHKPQIPITNNSDTTKQKKQKSLLKRVFGK